MFDIRAVRADPDAFDSGLARRGVPAAAERLLELDAARREHVARLQSAQNERNAASKAIGAAKARGDEQAAAAAIAEVSKIKAFLQTASARESELTDALDEALAVLPNIPSEDVPNGDDEQGNVVERKVGERTKFEFKPREHFELGEALGMMDFDAAAKLAGSRFVVLTGGLARLERALGQFMIDLQVDQGGYTEVQPPLLVRGNAAFGTGQLPKFEDDLFQTTDGRWLIPTAEVPLTNLVRDEILDVGTLPKRVAALTPCFRQEAGSAGRDTRGMLRQHQFNKCEMVSIVEADEGEAELERMLDCAERVLVELDLPYRVVRLCTGDLGFTARKTFDLEVWLPGQGAYREISSCSLCGDFQARRMNARFRNADNKIEFVHTLNGSGIAVGRALIAVMENHQRSDGSIAVPRALAPYMRGVEAVAA